jgi:hypothetical protein
MTPKISAITLPPLLIPARAQRRRERAGKD